MNHDKLTAFTEKMEKVFYYGSKQKIALASATVVSEMYSYLDAMGAKTRRSLTEGSYNLPWGVLTIIPVEIMGTQRQVRICDPLTEDEKANLTIEFQKPF